VAGLLLLVVLAIAAGAVLVINSKASLTADSAALARVQLPLGGGQIQSISVVTGPHSTPVAVDVRGRQIWPHGQIPTGQQVSIDAVIKRPGWISWLTGSTEHLRLTLTTPSAHLRSQYTTLSATAPLRVQFTQPVSVYSYGVPGHLTRQTLAAPSSSVTLPRRGSAGSIWVAGAPRSWESTAPTLVSWFPAGTAAGVVANPSPGTQITANAPITLTFSKPVDQVLGRSRPPISPTTAGSWHTLNSHTIVFRPEGFGYGLGAKVKVGLPSEIGVVGGSASWRVPRGSTLRLQQLLADLGYLPLRFNSQGPAVPPTPDAQEQAAVKPPAGSFSWRYGNVPAPLHSFWQPGSAGEMTRGAVMMFQGNNGLAPDGDAGAATWKALLGAAITGHRSSFGYSFVTVDKGAQRLSLWHDGRTVVTAPVNTGIKQAPTASGTFAVYEHLRVTTMSGTNPDGSHYHDPGIQFVSYFNGGDALHAFTRAQYGFPQSLGCVEMALAPAGKVWPYTPIGTLVHVA
jgi:peptidoglycan hydrolase-like protein with peptidoglycan-binding domain